MCIRDRYNTVIVDVSYRYPKMYVIRPQFFIPMITLLRNASLNALRYKQEMCIRDRIEGASEGVGLGHEFLRHIERTKVLIHVVDAAGTEGRDPITDIYAINAELANYSEELSRKPQVIAANKTDAIYDLEESPVEQLRREFGPKGIDVFPISAVSGKGVNELLYHVRQMLDGLDEKPTVFEQEYFPEMALAVSDEPYTCLLYTSRCV